MSIHRTLKLRGRDPIAEIAAALRAHTLTGALPPLPESLKAPNSPATPGPAATQSPATAPPPPPDP